MRLFIALPLPEAGRAQVSAYLTRLRKAGAAGNFTRPVNLHMTMAFLGEQPDPARAEAALERLSFRRFPYVLNRLDRFRQRDSELLYLGPDRNERFQALAAALWRELKAEGFQPENRRFTAHLTLCRELRNAEAASRLPPPEVAAEAEELILYLSSRVNGVLTYTPLARQPAAD